MDQTANTPAFDIPVVGQWLVCGNGSSLVVLQHQHLWRVLYQMFYLMMHSAHCIYSYMELYIMVKDKWDNERGNPLLPLCELLFPLNSKGCFIWTIQRPGWYIPQAFLHTSYGIRNSWIDPPEGISLMTHHTMSRCSSMTQCLAPVLSEADYRSHFSLLAVNGLRSVPSASSVHWYIIHWNCTHYKSEKYQWA